MNIIEHIGSLVSGRVASLKILVAIFKLEAKLAGMSIVPLIISISLLFIVVITVWACLMLLLGYFALLFLGNFPLMLASILGLNLIFFFCVLRYLTYNLSNLSFKRTRSCLTAHEDLGK